MSYERVVAAALAETRSKFALAEALALDIPPRLGRTAEGEISTHEYLRQARDQIIDAGGEPRAVGYLGQCRATALWVMEPGTVSFRWIPGVSFTAHNEARMAGMSFDAFAANPRSSQAIREEYGKADKTIPPEKTVKSWTPEQKASAARELLSDPEVTARPEVAEVVTAHVAADPKLTTDVIRKRQDAAGIREVQSRPERDYDAMVEQFVNLGTVIAAAESSGKWKPNERSEALLYFMAQILGERRVPTGEMDDLVNQKLEDLFADVEAYANSEAS